MKYKLLRFSLLSVLAMLCGGSMFADDTKAASTVSLDLGEYSKNIYENRHTHDLPTAKVLDANNEEVPNTYVTWTSSNTQVAEVASSFNGLSIKGPGTTTITATFPGNGGYESSSASFELTVSKISSVHLYAFVAAQSGTQVEQGVLNSVSMQLFNRIATAQIYPQDLTSKEEFYYDQTTGLYKLSFKSIIVGVDGVGITYALAFNKTYAEYYLNNTWLPINKAGQYDINFTYDPNAGFEKQLTVETVYKQNSKITINGPKNASAILGDRTFALPTVTITAGDEVLQNAPIEWSVTYTDIAEYDPANNQLILKKVGSTPVTARFPGDDTHAGIAESFNLVVVNEKSYHIQGNVWSQTGETEAAASLRKSLEKALFGNFTGFSNLQDSEKMLPCDDGKYRLTRTDVPVYVEKGEVTGFSWSVVSNKTTYAEGAGWGTYEFKESGLYDVTFIYDPQMPEGKALTVEATRKQALFIIGDNNSWDLSTMEKMQVSEEGNYELDIISESENFYFTVSDVPVAADWNTFNANYRYATVESDIPDKLTPGGERKQMQKQLGTQLIVGRGTYKIKIDGNYGITIQLIGEGGSSDEEETKPVWWTNTPIAIENPIKITKEALKELLKDKPRPGDRIRFRITKTTENAMIRLMTYDGREIEGVRSVMRVVTPAPHAPRRAAGSLIEVDFVLTGDILSITEKNGLQVAGNGFEMNAIEIAPTPEEYSDQSVWITSPSDPTPVIAPCHFTNYDEFAGVKKGTAIRVTFGETIASPEESLKEVLKYLDTTSSPKMLTCGTDFEIVAEETSDIKTVSFVIKTDDAAETLKQSLGVSIDAPGKTVKEVALVESSALGINAVKTDTDESAPTYDLSGRRVTKNYKGMVIQNGRKFIK